MKHIYELQRIDIRGRRYPQRRTNLASMGFFSTQENAVEAMQCFLADFTNFDYDCKYPTWLGFVVTKYGVDSGKCEPLYQCTYSHEGKFNDENLADENGAFRGRPAELLRFGKGDIVEVYDGESCLASFSPPLITWLLVTMYPSAEIITPLPAPLRSGLS